MLDRASLLLLCAFLAGCATSFRDRPWLDRQLRDRIGTGTSGAGPCGDSRDALPTGVRIADGIDEAEVVSIALCRNPALRAELARIDAARATLDDAGRPANPQLSMMGPVGPITAVATLLVPLESLWQMPSRTEAAAREADVAGEAVLMRALDIARDARLIHVDLGLATERVHVRADLAQIAREAARIASVRAGVGEISPLEANLLLAEARTSTDAADLAGTEVVMARSRLVASLGIDDPRGSSLRPTFSTDIATTPARRETLAFARKARPDARAAELAILAATSRAGWERSRILNLGALVETQWNQSAGAALRLGGRIELPIFNQNQGGIGRADAEIERAIAQSELVARTVIMEVTLALARMEQATRSRLRFDEDVITALEAALDTARQSFETGDQPIPVVLDVARRLAEARLRRAELVADQRRALCDLERSIGSRLVRVAHVASHIREERGGL